MPTQQTTRSRILSAADSLFGQASFDSTTTREIAEVSGVNKALIHYHFATKEGLFGAVLDRYFERLREALAATLAAEGELLERLERTLDAYVDFLSENHQFARMVQREASGGRQLQRVIDQTAPVFEAAAASIRAAYPVTRSGPLEASQLLVSFYGMVITYITYGDVLAGLVGTDPLAPQAVAKRKAHLRHMLHIVLETLRAADDES